MAERIRNAGCGNRYGLGVLQMSLINQMLQELDARGTSAGGAGILQSQVRVVPDRRGVHPAWWAVIVLGVFLCAAATWIWLGRSNVPTPAQMALLESAELPLKLAADLGRIPSAEPSPEIDRPKPISLASRSMKQAEESAKPAAGASQALVSDTTIMQPAPASVSKEAVVSASAQVGTSIAKPSGPDSERKPAAINAASATTKPFAPAALATSASAPAAAFASASVAPSSLTKQIKEPTSQQNAENEFRKGATLAQQGKTPEAITALEIALQFDSHHTAARQTLVALLVESKRTDEAIRRLREGLQADPAQSGLAMILARLQVEKGELKAAIDSLQRVPQYASDRADFQAFLAALLQRDNRHKEAAERYAIALKKSPQNGIWWMGLGISLQAENRTADATDAYNRAKSTGSLSPELRAFVDEKLNGLPH